MSHSKQFTLYSTDRGTNGWKINFVLEVLGLSYEQVNLDFQKNEHKGPEFLKINPNGRIPALVDHDNNDFTIWESNAITQYLVDRYDKERKISVAPGTEEYYTQLQWLYFQASGQGPYYGQAGWFLLYSPEKIPSAIERYRNEIRRVLGVLESVLSNREWLVGDKATVADISFIPWNEVVGKFLLENFDFEKEFPATARWHNKLLERPGISKVWAEWVKAFPK